MNGQQFRWILDWELAVLRYLYACFEIELGHMNDIPAELNFK